MTDFDSHSTPAGDGRGDPDTSHAHDGAEAKRRPGEPFDRQRIRAALRRYGWWIASAVVMAAVAGIFVAKYVMPRSYVSTAVLRYEGTPSVFDDEVRLPPGEELDSLITAFRIDPVIGQLKRELHITAENTRIVELMEIDKEFRSDTVFVTMPGDSPDGAARTVDTLARIFMDYHRDQQAARIDEAVASLAERIESATDALDQARHAYAAFRREHGIGDLSAERLESITASADLRARTDLAGSEIAALEARVAGLRARARAAPRSASRPTPERQQLTHLESDLAAARTEYSGDHPRVRSLALQVATLRQRISAGDTTPVTGAGTGSLLTSIRNALSETETDLAAARRRRDALGEQAGDARSRVTEFSGLEGEATSLLARQQVAEALVTTLRNRRVQLEDARRNVSSGFRVMAPGSIPEWPEADKKRYLVAAALPLLVLLIGAALAFTREFHGLRVRTPREVAWWGHGPVVGCTTWPRDPKSLMEFIADLDDYVPTARGHLLLVGASEEECSLAWSIVDQLRNDWKPTQFLDLDSYVPPPGPAALTTPAPMALALPRKTLEHLSSPPHLDVTAWEGPPRGQGIRRAARLADRVAVVLRSGSISGVELSKIIARIGRSSGVGFIVVGIADDLADLPDRVGEIAEFWTVHE